jgi:hypothetical protein
MIVDGHGGGRNPGRSTKAVLKYTGRRKCVLKSGVQGRMARMGKWISE